MCIFYGFTTKHDFFNLHKVAPVRIRAVVVFKDRNYPMQHRIEIHINKGDAAKMMDFQYMYFPIGLGIVYVEH